MFTQRIDEITEDGLNLDWEETQASLSSYLENFRQIDFLFETPLKGEAKVWKAGQSIVVKGRVETVLRFRCVRCLEEFSHPLSSTFDLTLNPSKEMNSEEEVELSEEDMESSFFEGGEIRLSEIACEQIFLDIPYQPVCKEDCKGLCPVCGRDLNRGSCGCHAEVDENRFAVLRKLKLDHE